MNRSYTADVYSACGAPIAIRNELPFSTKKAWRERVADHLGCDRQFIVNLGMKTRIHRYHFSEDEIVGNKPVGLPNFNIEKIPHWQPSKLQLVRESVVARPAFDDEEENDENIENEKADLPNFVCVELNQLKLLPRHCYICGNRIFDDSVKYSTRGGILFVKYWCSSCTSHRYFDHYF